MALLSDEEVFGFVPPQPTNVPPVPKGLLSDEEVFGAPSNALPQATPQKLLSDAEVFGTDTQVSSVAAPPPVEDTGAFGSGNSISRGFFRGLLEENPKMGAEALEGLSYRAPEALQPILRQGSDTLRRLAISPEAYQTRAKRLKDVGSLDEGLTWAGETLGQGLASTVPSLVTGLGGAAAGMAVAGPVGGFVGGMTGATIPSFGLNYAEVFKALKDEKLDPDAASQYALYAAVPMAALDVASVGPIIARLGGFSKVREELSKDIARRIATEAAKGAGREGITEAAQEAVKNATVSLAADKPFWSQDNVWSLAESGLGGALVGGTVGGVTAPFGAKPKLPPATEKEIKDAFTAATQTPPSDGGADGTSVSAESQLLGGEPPPWYYSQVRKVAEEKLPESGTGAQMLATLRNAAGVKDEELQWLGLPQWLDERPQVSRQELLAEIEANAVRIEEQVHTDISSQLRWDKDGVDNIDVWTSGDAPGWRIQRTPPTPVSGSFYKVMSPEGAAARFTSTLEEAQGFVAREIFGGTPAQYAQYTLPGGENYKERLFILPQKPDPRGPAFGPDPFESPHWAQGDVLAHIRTTERTDLSGKKGLLVEEIQSDWHQQGRAYGYSSKLSIKEIQRLEARLTKLNDLLKRDPSIQDQSLMQERTQVRNRLRADRLFGADDSRPPDAPFKTSWPDLVVKRLLKLAVEEGRQRIYFTEGAEQVRRYPQMEETNKAGLREFYDRIVPRLVEKWAKKLGGQTGTTQLELPDGSHASVRYVEVTDAMRMNLSERPLPLFSKLGEGEWVGNKESSGVAILRPIGPKPPLFPAMQLAGNIINILSRKMELNVPIRLVMTTETPQALGKVEGDVDGGYTIKVWLNQHSTAEEVYATVAHEFGHIIMWQKFKRAPATTKLVILAAYEQYKENFPYAEKLQDILSVRDNFITQVYNSRRLPRRSNTITLEEMSSKDREYWLGFEEWFAEQVAQWMTTARKPLGIVDQFFAALGRQLRTIYQIFKERTGLRAEPDEWVASWLDSLADQSEMRLARELLIMEGKTQETAVRDLRAAGFPQFPAESQTASTTLGRSLASALGVAEDPDVKVTVAAADHMNKFHKWMLSMVQLADLNPHIAPLQRYRELFQQQHLERTEIMNEALTTAKEWRGLGRREGDAVAGLIDDYMNLEFLTEEERAQGVNRMPTEEEFAKLVRKNQVSGRGLQLFRKVQGDFQQFLLRIKDALIRDAKRISDPINQEKAIHNIETQMKMLAERPYFPAMRFGNLTLVVRDAAGQIQHVEFFEKERQRRRAERIAVEKFGKERVKLGYISEDATPLMGLPPGLLDKIGEKLELSNSQRQALELLKFELAPAQSFKHRFQRKERIAGYSKDFLRAYANYFFHGSNYLTRVKYLQDMRDQILVTKESAKELYDGTKRLQIAEFMENHLAYNLNPRSDFARLRAFTFHFALGFSPAAATLNLTQMVFGSYPMLANEFGDLKAIAAIGRAGRQLSTYYKRGTLKDLSDRDMRALSEGIKEGIITEAMAPELAALTEGRNLEKGFAGNAMDQSLIRLAEWSSFFFEMSEQWNRRVTFRAAWQLASDNPASAYVQRAKEKHVMLFDKLRAQGWTERDAAAFVTAKDATNATQFVYQQYAQPRFMRGKLRTVFIFKTFVQNMLFMMWNYPGAGVRTILMMGILGGLMGVPGGEDLRGIIKAISYRLFGKDYDIEEEARKFALELFKGKIPPDLILHGMARRGFGIPAVMDTFGVPFPVLDRSKAVSMGNLLPVDVGALAGFQKDQSRAIADSTQKASGAAFGIAFNMYKALTDGQLDWNDFKRWERMMPRALASASKAYRAFSEGQERNRLGNPVVRFDVTDPRQMAEVLAMGLGYQPLRLSATWDRIIAEREAIAYWDTRRQMLMRQAWAAQRSGNTEGYQGALGAIRKFNADLPPEARGKAITADSLRASFQARARAAQAQETGVPTQKSNVPIVREIQRLYPEANVSVRPVR